MIACNHTLDNQSAVAGLICESFAYQVPAPDFALAVLKGLSHIAPHAHVLKLPKEQFSRDPKVVQGRRRTRRSSSTRATSTTRSATSARTS